MLCIMCGDSLDIQEMCEAAWTPDPWCFECKAAEDKRSLEDDTLPDSVVRWRKPRYLITAYDWYEVNGMRVGYIPPEDWAIFTGQGEVE